VTSAIPAGAVAGITYVIALGLTATTCAGIGAVDPAGKIDTLADVTPGADE
jgi:hypothetical protein